ncbi:MAG: sigma-54 dependent transcriptional regulator [Zoogloeaceae bacterium]|jgi:two-component system response regulator HupR/HoxA|nr:sigma-54 dependent transcriptional regulator [Zoogloeaceae bacterium]
MTILPTILVVDDEVRSQETLRRTLEEEFNVLVASSGEQALALLEREPVEVILCDQRMPGLSGVETLKEARSRWPDTVRIIVSGYTETEDIISGINEAGIYQYLLKPWHPESLLLTVRAAAELHRLQQENQRLNIELRTAGPVARRRVEAKRQQVKREFGTECLIRAPDSPINDLCRLAERIAPYDIPVLITGESGTGKELLARAIHYSSSRADKAFVVENCGALPDTLLESELFGHKRGAFTGAYENRIGLFQQADGGTIFLDEIGETSPAFQVKLLRVLQEGEIRPVGASQSISVDVRVISATNRDLEADVRQGRFRQDLYYRLSTMTLHVPALRERPHDIPFIARQALEKAVSALGKAAAGFTPEAMDCLTAYRWPGNVRELRNEIHRMLALADGDWLGAEYLNGRVVQAASIEEEAELRMLSGINGSLKDRLEMLEARVLKEAMVRHRWNKTRVADELGLSRVGLRAKLTRYGLERKGGAP